MGIPRFYRFITDRFPNVSTQVSFNSGFDQKVDNLYLDANGILHNCARELYFPPKPRKKRFAPRLSKAPEPMPATELQVFQAIGKYMDQLLKFVRPRKLFYIAIDGPAPLAKQTQQRQRRFKSAQDRSPEERGVFDSTAITPGTAFMYRLSKFLRFYIRAMMSTDRDWNRISVIFSGPDSPGEGEHKIAEYIRSKGRKNEVHCMYGLDADLFMLSLASHCPRFYLLREDQFTVSWSDTFFYKVNIGKLRNQLFTEWDTVGGNIEQLIDDFIFICFLVGNDFLHALPTCTELADSIEFLMAMRQQVLGSSYISADSAFNLDNLLLLLQSISTVEGNEIAATWSNQNFPNVTLTSSFIDPQFPAQGIDMKKYRKLYYAKAGIDADVPEQVQDFCQQYIQGLEWVQWYYHKWPLNWQWFFPYHYTPLVSDIVGYLTSANIRLHRVSTQKLPPVEPFEQLLCVVPPQSKQLLPEFLYHIYTDPQLRHFYPTTFDIDLEGKHREWEGIALLPFIPLADVKTAYQRAQRTDGKKYLRNKFGSTILFKYTRNKRYTYTSDYGKIVNCSIGTFKV